jgi:hypothetical protein
MPARVEQARTVEDVERLASLWDAAGWGREEAERDYLVTRVKLRSEAVAPFGALAVEGERVVAALAGRIEERPLPATVGYRTVYAPRVRILQLVEGGVVASDGSSLDGPLGVVRAMLQNGEIDAVAVPPLPVGSAVHGAFARLGGPLERQPFIRAWQRRRLPVDRPFAELVAERSSRVRLARYARSLDRRLGGELAVEITRDVAGFDRFVAAAEAVAASAYQRALGAGFADTDEQRELSRLSIERGWQRGYALRIDGEPAAYWLCSTYGGTMTTRVTGYDPSREHDRVGSYLMLRVIEDACLDPSLGMLDFGPGDADYKRHFASESLLEQHQFVFAPTLRGRRVNLARSVILGSAGLARALADATGVTGAVRTRWRERLRGRAT